jgi:hypothetical protein
MPDETLRTIELPETHLRIVLKQGPAPLVQRDGDTNYLCGTCSAVLAKHVWMWEVRNVVFRCPQCGANNEIAHA